MLLRRLQRRGPLLVLRAYISMVWHEGDVIRKLRLSVKWTLADLSRASGVNMKVINRIETGETREAKRSTLDRIALAFGLSGHLDLIQAVPAGHHLMVRPRTLPPAQPARASAVIEMAAPRRGPRKRKHA